MELIINFLWSLPNASMESSERLNLGRMLQNTKFNLRIQSYFSVKARQTLEFWEALCLYWIYLKTYFVVIQKPKANLMRDWIFVNWSRMLNLVNEHKTIFIGNRHKPWDLWKPWKVSILIEPYIKLLSDLIYWNKVQKCQTCLKNTKTQTWELSKKCFSIYRTDLYISSEVYQLAKSTLNIGALNISAYKSD